MIDHFVIDVTSTRIYNQINHHKKKNIGKKYLSSKSISLKNSNFGPKHVIQREIFTIFPVVPTRAIFEKMVGSVLELMPNFISLCSIYAFFSYLRLCLFSVSIAHALLLKTFTNGIWAAERMTMRRNTKGTLAANTYTCKIYYHTNRARL